MAGGGVPIRGEPNPGVCRGAPPIGGGGGGSLLGGGEVGEAQGGELFLHLQKLS